MMGDFTKPIVSKRIEENFIRSKTKNAGSLNEGDRYYYLIPFKKKEYIKKEGKYLPFFHEKDAHHSLLKNKFVFYSKEEIDKFPKYMRRGGEYGHDQVKINKDNIHMRNAKLYKKLYNMNVKNL